jgi:putative membrane protein
MEQTQSKSLLIHYLIRAFIMAGFSWYIIYLVQIDHLHYYIAPRMQIYVKLSAIALIILAVYQVYLAWQSVSGNQAEACGCEHPPSTSLWRNMITYSLFIVPLALGFILPDTLLGSTYAANKGVTLSSSATVKQKTAQGNGGTVTGTNPTPTPTSPQAGFIPAPSSSSPPSTPSTNNASTAIADAELKALFKSDPYTEDHAKLAMKLYKKDLIQVPDDGFIETVNSVDIFLEPFIGKKIQLSGFVFRDEDMKPEQFVVARMAMSCCSADVYPFGIMVEAAIGKSLSNDTWVQVTGTIKQTNYRKNDIMMIAAEKIERVATPKNTYVYPNYEFLVEGN